ncbi:peptidoglycan-binding domain-containing protein [Streptomyces sp. YU58]|uniref:peptidoglycan-binding domain-containing protein n=1 Tax=Streptomyces sp. SX92 TaxID=3158972 RepID=UPI0027BA04FA|nr:peptidoglycan-binding domain-containing protein [Streptomyces coralus]WLW50411.1 peptidoglycan-binding domain-containing protein [Streptomyces coralus]
MPRSTSPRVRAALATGAFTATLLTGAIATAPAASSASYPTCNGVKTVSLSSTASVRQPYYTGNGTRNCVLASGSSSTAVAALQDALITCYKQDTGGKDGIYGSKTRQAVWNVQGRYDNLVQDGVYGPETRKMMGWRVYTNGSATTQCTAPGT